MSLSLSLSLSVSRQDCVTAVATLKTEGGNDYSRAETALLLAISVSVADFFLSCTIRELEVDFEPSPRARKQERIFRENSEISRFRGMGTRLFPFFRGSYCVLADRLREDRL